MSFIIIITKLFGDKFRQKNAPKIRIFARNEPSLQFQWEKNLVKNYDIQSIDFRISRIIFLWLIIKKNS